MRRPLDPAAVAGLLSTSRVQRDRGYCVPSRLPRGPNGRALCRRCGVEVPPGRLSFCSQACIKAWKIKTNPGYVRQLVFTRDRGVCWLCGLDTCAAVLARRFPHQRRWAAGTGHLWQADHVIPVSEGGGECGLENYRTLCTACHKAETRELARRRAAQRHRAPRR